MKAYNLQTLASAMKGTLLQPSDGEIVISSGVSTDTRNLPEGSLFFALKGENFDAHNFLDQAASAAAIVVDQQKKVPVDFPAILVEDVLSGLQRLAHWYDRELAIPTIAITGSNGKTSTKDFTRSVLSQKYKVNATVGNLNNHIGLPLTVLATERLHEIGVYEMGMNHSGELAPLCEISPPDISIITNVGSAHIENMGSRAAIAEEKGTVARALTEKGTLLIPADCEFIEDYRARTKGKILVVGNGRGTVRAENLVMDANGSRFDLVIDDLGRVETTIPIIGKHMVSNALLAAGAGYTLGLSLEEISAGLAATQLASGRLHQFDYDGIAVIDDTYNANPESVAAALETLAALPCEGSRIAVLGKMAELGDHAQATYEKTGELAAALHLRLVVVGDDAKTISTVSGGAEFFSTAEEASKYLKSHTAPGDLVLFKGSRAASMECVMNQVYPPKY